MQRVLVTGGAGFIGSHVSEAFLARGWAVDILDNFSSGKRENVPADCAVHEVDVRSEEAVRIVKSGKYDVLIHLAAQMDVRRSVADPVFDAQVNIIGTLNLVEAIRSSSPTTRFVFASTGGVLYGDFVKPPNLETFAKDPESPYAISKLSVEYYLAYYLRVHRLDSVALRFGNVYGPRQDPHGEAGVVAIFCGRLLDGKELTIFGDGKQTRDYVFVRDVSQATYAAATSSLPGAGRLDTRGLNIGTGIGTSVLQVADTLMNAAGTKTPLQFAPPRPGEQQHSYIDISKARKLLAWEPATSLEDGLQESYRWFQQQRAIA